MNLWKIHNQRLLKNKLYYRFLEEWESDRDIHAVIEGAFRVTDRGGSLALKELSLRRSKIKPW